MSNQQIKSASIRLGIEFEQRYERLLLAVGENETLQAATALGMLFNDNVEFIIWALKKSGGLLNVKSPEPIRSPSREFLRLNPTPPANDGNSGDVN